MKKIWNSFSHSLKLPQKKSVFYLNRIGMDITVIYMFILLAITSIPALLDQMASNKQSTLQLHPFFLSIYFFIFYYLVITITVFCIISLIAYVWTFIAKLLQRKLRFAILWKMVAYSTTIPFILFTVISFFYPVSYYFLFITIIYIFIILFKILLIYPRRKRRI